MKDANTLTLEQKISEIERINAETRKLLLEGNLMNAEMRKKYLEGDFVNAETRKQLLEGNLTHKKTTWYELTLVAAFIGGSITAGVAIAKLFFS